MVTMDISPAHAGLIESLKLRCGFATDKEVVEEALVLAGWAVGEAAKGRAVGAVTEDGTRMNVVQMPLLDSVAKKAAKPDTDGR